MYDRVEKQIDELKDDMKNDLMKMLKIPALGPTSNGDGEMEKAEFLMKLIDDFGFDSIERYDAPDPRVNSGKRPNIVATKQGKSDISIVILAHMDIVPEGDLDQWDTDPYDPKFIDGKIYGRGAEDNGQEIIAALYAGKALKKAGVDPHYTLKVVLVSDEETGSEYGVEYILAQDVIQDRDMIIVPDHSEENGKFIEVVEKSGLWVKVTCRGKQGHAAMPGGTINANRAVAEYQYMVDERLKQKFHSVKNEMFSHPFSSFEPTKRDKNVPNVNTIPGKEVQYFDCRIIPDVSISKVKSIFENAAEEMKTKYGAGFQVEYVMESKAPPGTPIDSKVVEELSDAVEKVTGHRPSPVGIGGGTVAAHFRKRGLPAVVWCSNHNLAHQPNEYALLSNMVRDCKVFCSMLFGD
ncbi:MAG: M20 family metallo-hydrolase [Thermoplasmata archaeon]